MNLFEEVNQEFKKHKNDLQAANLESVYSKIRANKIIGFTSFEADQLSVETKNHLIYIGFTVKGHSNPGTGPDTSYYVVSWDDRTQDQTKLKDCPECWVSTALAPHTCPYASEITYNDKLCECCTECMALCSDEL